MEFSSFRIFCTVHYIIIQINLIIIIYFYCNKFLFFLFKTKFHIKDPKLQYLLLQLKMEQLKYLNHQLKIIYFSYSNNNNLKYH